MKQRSIQRGMVVIASFFFLNVLTGCLFVGVGDGMSEGIVGKGNITDRDYAISSDYTELYVKANVSVIYSKGEIGSSITAPTLTHLELHSASTFTQNDPIVTEKLTRNYHRNQRQCNRF